MGTLSFFLHREQIIKLVRQFFYKQGFHEIITPVLNESIPLEPNIYPFETQWNTTKGMKRFYLSTSPEKHLKKMLALGIGNCFSISHSFRNLEASGPLHSPEFLMLEWYRKNADYTVIMNDVQKLFVSINQSIDTYLNKRRKSCFVDQKWNRLSIEKLFHSKTHIPFKRFVTNNAIIVKYAKLKGYETNNSSWNELYDQIFVNEIEPLLPLSPLFLIDFPSRISPLCKPKKNEPYLAERFEFYIDRIELANGNTENTDVKSILKLFKTEQAKRSSLKSPIPLTSRIAPIPIDHEFLKSLRKMGDSSYAGVGLGLDRLATVLTNKGFIL